MSFIEQIIGKLHEMWQDFKYWVYYSDIDDRYEQSKKELKEEWDAFRGKRQKTGFPKTTSRKGEKVRKHLENQGLNPDDMDGVLIPDGNGGFRSL